MTNHTAIVRYLGLKDYTTVWKAMQRFTDQRHNHSLDEIWAVEHHPVYTLGQNGKKEHLLYYVNIPLVPVDRGGQITYHGPGQLVIYTMIDIQRKKMNVREMVTLLETAVLTLLKKYGIHANTECKAPGVYIENKKICSIGLRIRRGRAFHGLAFNVLMDLKPFTYINPCGFSGLQMTQLAEYYPTADLSIITQELIDCLTTNLGYNDLIYSNGTVE